MTSHDLRRHHPLLRRLSRLDLTACSGGWNLPCPGCGAEAAPSGLFESDPTANYASVTVALSADGQRLRIRRCSGGCSALRIAVALNLEIRDFEPWDVPAPAPAPPEVPQCPKPSRPSGSESWQSDADTYSALRACVQAVLDAPAGDRTRVVREQHEAALAIPGLPAARAHGAISAAAKAAGMGEAETTRVLEVWV